VRSVSSTDSQDAAQVSEEVLRGGQLQVASRKSQVASRKSQVASRKSQATYVGPRHGGPGRALSALKNLTAETRSRGEVQSDSAVWCAAGDRQKQKSFSSWVGSETKILRLARRGGLRSG
jgi:hypothetical protein